MEAEWCIYASVKHNYTAWDNGLLPVWHKAIIWTNAAILSVRPKFYEILPKVQVFIQENVLENVVCEMAAILYHPQCVKQNTTMSSERHSSYWSEQVTI